MAGDRAGSASMRVTRIDGDEWIAGSGFPGWSFGGFVLFFLIAFAGAAAIGVHDLAHRTADWSNWLTIFVSVVDLGLLIGASAILLLLLLLLAHTIWLWSTTFQIHADDRGIRIRFCRLGGLLIQRLEIPVAIVTDISARMSSAVGDRQNLDISVRAGRRSRMVFRCGRSQDAEMVVAYLDRACGRPLRPDLAARLDQAWATTKERISRQT